MPLLTCKFAILWLLGICVDVAKRTWINNSCKMTCTLGPGLSLLFCEKSEATFGNLPFWVNLMRTWIKIMYKKRPVIFCRQYFFGIVVYRYKWEFLERWELPYWCLLNGLIVHLKSHKLAYCICRLTSQVNFWHTAKQMILSVKEQWCSRMLVIDNHKYN
jgi:hypothetical protein